MTIEIIATIGQWVVIPICIIIGIDRLMRYPE